MKKYNKIYVLAPYKYTTGGVELSHQLVDYLRNKNQEAYIVYIENLKISENQNITKAYNAYNIKTTKVIEDSPNNIVILPEIYFEFIIKLNNIQIGCWWMSVDNYYRSSNILDNLCFEKNMVNRIKILKRYICGDIYKYKNSIKLLHNEEHRIIHFYQSHYAQYHLYSLGMSKVLPLSDYINSEIENEINDVPKENIILYNPKKGLKFTQKIISNMLDFKFIPLQGFNRNELNGIFDKAKLYIDFGEFPGKDRLPREAAIHRCCIISGKNGASFFYEDLPIKEKYKFDTKSKNISNICTRIKEVLLYYDKCIKDFENYRNIICKEKNIFYNEIEDIFM